MLLYSIPTPNAEAGKAKNEENIAFNHRKLLLESSFTNQVIDRHHISQTQRSNIVLIVLGFSLKFSDPTTAWPEFVPPVTVYRVECTGGGKIRAPMYVDAKCFITNPLLRSDAWLINPTDNMRYIWQLYETQFISVCSKAWNCFDIMSS